MPAPKGGKTYRIAVFDAETDPFKNGEPVAPFSCGLLIEGGEYVDFWGDDCFEQCDAHLRALDGPPLKIYAHNGGKFDWVFLVSLKLLDPGSLKVISGRLAKGKWGKHEIRDSYSIIPVPLAQLQTRAGIKGDIDYRRMEREVREQHRDEILAYQKQDCEVTLAAVLDFRERHGDKLTIGGAAISVLREMHPFDKMRPEYDEQIRPYFFGGRVECFEKGELPGPWNYYDVNSMYPHVMRDFDHFCGTGDPDIYWRDDAADELNPDGTHVDGFPFFITFAGISRGALPVRGKFGSLSFPHGEGIYQASHHELIAGIELGLIEVHQIEKLIVANSMIRFGEFVDTFYREKSAAKARGDKASELNAKLLLNSAYGKTAQNPADFEDWRIEPYENVQHYRDYGWKPSIDYEGEGLVIMSKPRDTLAVGSFFDVGIGASITGAARAVMMRALDAATDPVYCDTDSIICKRLPGRFCDPGKLGLWDTEWSAPVVWIGGKKMYGAHATDPKGRTADKTSSKGVRLPLSMIKRVANGQQVTYIADAPVMSLRTGGKQRQLKRRVKMT